MSVQRPLDLADHDLAALQEVRLLLDQARGAASALAGISPEEGKRLAKAVGAALLPRAAFYAE